MERLECMYKISAYYANGFEFSKTLKFIGLQNIVENDLINYFVDKYYINNKVMRSKYKKKLKDKSVNLYNM